jgi:hypothetical protein
MYRQFRQWGLIIGLVLGMGMQLQAQELKIVFIRHGEKPLKGDNLTCQGLNRSLALPAVLYAKFGIPAYTYVPSMEEGSATKHARMFQTVSPFAARYNLTINSSLQEKDSASIAKELLSRKGTVLVVWEHKAIPSIVRALGLKDDDLHWSDDDFDSIWIVTFDKGAPILSKDNEHIQPAAACPGS